MVALSTQPPSADGKGGTSVPPPANEIRSGALARIRGRGISLTQSLPPAPPPRRGRGQVFLGWSDGRDAVLGVVVPRGHGIGYLVYLVDLLLRQPLAEGSERRARVHRPEPGAGQPTAQGPATVPPFSLSMVCGRPRDAIVCSFCPGQAAYLVELAESRLRVAG